MGYIAHDAVIAVVSGYDTETINAIAAFKASMDNDRNHDDMALGQTYSQFLVGPVVGVNGYHMYAFLPDGSNEGWGPSDRAQELRARFTQIAKSGNVVAVRFGGDFEAEYGPQIVKRQEATT